MLDGEKAFRILGSGGGIGTTDRQACSALLVSGKRGLIIDGGTGLLRIAQDPELILNVEHIDIVLTHFHMDHLAGLCFAPRLNLPQSVTVWGPGKWLYGVTTKEILHGVMRQPTLHADLEELFPDVREINSRDRDLGAFSVGFREQQLHSSPTVGIRIEDLLAYCTDTALDRETVPFVSGVDLLFHDAWWSSSHRDAIETHASGSQAARIAADGGVGALRLIHLHPINPTEEAEREAQVIFPNSARATDLDPLFFS